MELTPDKKFIQKHKKLNQVLTDIKKINTISLNNFLEIQIHDQEFIHRISFCINAY